jgi:predicted RNA-binding protein with TRAM domain
VRDKGPMYFVKIRTETEDGDGNAVATGLWNLVIRH